MIYELWDNSTGNIMDAFERESEAVALVETYAAADGIEFVERLGLRAIDDSGRTVWVRRGSELLNQQQVPA